MKTFLVLSYVKRFVIMTKIAIGYYAHHHGMGHSIRALTIAKHLPYCVTVFGSNLPAHNALANVTLCSLPSDFCSDACIDTPEGLHYAPLAIKGLRERMGVLVDWFRLNWPCLLVVDVSVEIALLARLFGVPTIYMRQRGHRFDHAHSLAYACASRLLAPYPIQFEEPELPAQWLQKTDYSGIISRYSQTPKRRKFDFKHVAVIKGFGGTQLTSSQLAEAARECPDWQWTVLGPVCNDKTSILPPNLKLLGIVEDPRQWLLSAHVVIGSAGDNLISEIADLRCRFICVPDHRPFDEQQSTGERLASVGLAICCSVWPVAQSWPSLLERAAALIPERWETFADGKGAVRAATVISNVAQEVL